jgi:ATP-dependent helicase/nuclease subunit A
LTPSAAVGAREGAGQLPEIDPADRYAAARGDRERRRGILIHRLLERLPARPAEERAAAARRWLDVRGADFDAAERAAIAEEVAAVLAEPAFAAIFGPRARAEVAIVGRLGDGHGETIEVSGRIDRLVDLGDEVWVVDFKSDRIAGAAEIPAHHVAQTALYRRLLAPLFPEKRIRAFLLWTTAARLDEIAAERLDRAADALAPT